MLTETDPAAPATPAFDKVLAGVRDLRHRLVLGQQETEERTRHSAQLQDELVQLGLFHLLRPRRFGGHELDVHSFLVVMRELARGCMSTAWSTCLSSGHNLQAASWWPENVQRELFSSHYFAAPATVTPGGTLTRQEGGWVVNSTHRYASGAPYSTHFIGTAKVRGQAETKSLSVFIAPREAWTMLDDWGQTLGLRGSGSNTVLFDHASIPEDWVLAGQSQTDMDVSEGTPGYSLHRNAMYAGRALGFYNLELATLAVGAVWGALDEYETLLLTRKSIIFPFGDRLDDPDYAAWYGAAHTRLCVAEAAIERAANMFMEFCERGVRGGAPFSLAEDILINMVAGEALSVAWQVIQDVIVRTCGSSAVTAGSRTERIWRDMTMLWSHAQSVLRNQMRRDFTKQHLASAAEAAP